MVSQLRYVVAGMTGRISNDYDDARAAEEWMQRNNPETGDCVMWQKVYNGVTLVKNLVATKLFAVRKDGKWIHYGGA